MKFNLPLIVSLLAAAPGLSSPMDENPRPLTMKLDDELPCAEAATSTAIATPAFPIETATESINLLQLTSSGAREETQETQALLGAEQFTTAATLPCLNSTFRTHIKIFMTSTGNDVGDNISEMQGYIEFPNVKKYFAANLPDETFFTSENSGYGRLLIDTQIVTAFIPANFRAYLAEHDAGGIDATVMDKRMDWTIPSNLQFANGLPWHQEWHNTGDIAYKAMIWYQVTKLS